MSPSVIQKIDFSKLNLQDALDLAVLIEEEAKERYEEFSKMLGERYDNDAHDVFVKMAANEAKHGEALLSRRKMLFGDAKVRVSRAMFDEVEAPDYSQPRQYMSPRQAALVALDSEKKAYDFFDQALKFVKDPEVKALFTELRVEEVEHQNLLKKLLEKLPPGEGPDKDDSDIDEPPAL